MRTHAVVLLALLLLPLSGRLSAPGAAPAAGGGVPGLARWEKRMVAEGRAICEYLGGPHKPDDLLAAVYYDGPRVFLQIADYTRDHAWAACADRAKTIYRDRYVLAFKGAVPGYWNFTHGLTLDYLKTGDPLSREAVISLSQNAAYTPDATPIDRTRTATRSREVAYAIMSYLNAERVGAPPRARLAQHVEQALGHLDQWFVSKTYRCEPRICDPPTATGQYYIQPFMVALTAEALIAYTERTPDARVLPAIKTALDWLWANAWVASDRAFWYDNQVPDPGRPFPPRPGAPDLNLIVAPVYAWVYRATGDVTYRRRADQIFAGGVDRAHLGSGKHFNQNYRTSFDYLRWRNGAPAAAPGVLLKKPGS